MPWTGPFLQVTVFLIKIYSRREFAHTDLVSNIRDDNAEILTSWNEYLEQVWLPYLLVTVFSYYKVKIYINKQMPWTGRITLFAGNGVFFNKNICKKWLLRKQAWH